MALLKHNDFGAVAFDGTLQGRVGVIFESDSLRLCGNLPFELLDPVRIRRAFIDRALLQLEVFPLALFKVGLQLLHLPRELAHSLRLVAELPSQHRGVLVLGVKLNLW